MISRNLVNRVTHRICVPLLVCLLLGVSLLAPGLTTANPDDPPSINVVSGRDATPGQFPHIASLRRSGSHFCGGDLIATNWVLTAAHCVQGVSPSSVTVVLGDHNRTTAESSEQSITASRIIVHPNYSNLNNDIALIQLSRAATLNTRVQTIPLATTADSAYYAHGKRATVAGWGATRYQGALATILQYAEDTIYDANSTSCTLRGQVNANTMICWGGSSTISACNGDSGGPFIINVNGTWKLVGKVSWGRSCQGSSIYTKVPTYVDWINQQTGGITPTPVTRTPTPITSTPTPVTRTPTPVTTTPTPGAVFADDFESDRGWAVNPDGTDTATLGQWERGDPEATDYNGPKQLGTTTSGSNDLVTGRLAGSGVGSYDLDGGVTSIRSPSISLPSSGNLALSLRYYLAHASNASSADYLRVKVVGDDPTVVAETVFERLGAASDVDASWQSATVDLSGYAGQTIRIVIEAADASTASLLEAAVDDLRITAN